jgi:hypothetical protein
MSYQSYEVLPLFLKNTSNTYTIYEIGDYGSWTLHGFFQYDSDDRHDFFAVQELLQKRYNLFLSKHTHENMTEIIQRVTDKVIHYRKGVRFTTAVVMN